MAREARLCDCDFQGYQQVDSGTKMIQQAHATVAWRVASSMTRSRSTEPITGRHNE
jgi:hypothetical protein